MKNSDEVRYEDKTNDEKNIFNIEYTLLIKGIAILMLLLHHLFYENIRITLGPVNLHTEVVILTKVCVVIFTILSGYGMTKSYEKNKKSSFEFVAEHISKVIINYWWVYIPVFFLSFFMHRLGSPFQIYGLGMMGIKNFIIDFVGLRAVFYTPTLNGAWWYIEVIVIFYFLFPLLYRGTKKYPVLTITLSTIPIVLLDVFNYFPKQLISIDREIYYLLPFLLGIFVADKKILDKLVNCCNNYHRSIMICASIILIICSQCLLRKFMMIGNVLYAFSIILFGIAIESINKHLSNGLEMLGKHSMNIFLVHSFYHGYFTVFRKLITRIPTVLLKYLTILSLSLGTSVIIEKCKSKFK